MQCLVEVMRFESLAMQVLFLLLPLVPVKETVNEAVAVDAGDDSLATPLLSEEEPGAGDLLPGAECLTPPTGNLLLASGWQIGKPNLGMPSQEG